MEYHTVPLRRPYIPPTHSKNRPTLVAYDLRAHVPEEVVYRSLYERGVFKLFYVREHLWRIVDMLLRIGKEAGTDATHHSAEYWRGYRQCALDDRAALKHLLELPKADCLPEDKTLLTYIQKQIQRHED